MKSDIFTSTFTDIRIRLLSMASRFLGNDDDANDALQDAFCKLWQRHENISTRSEAEALSVVTVKNLCIDSLRKKNNSKLSSLDECKSNLDIINDDDSGASEELYQKVQKIIDLKLSETQKIIIRMRDINDESYQSIAEKLEMQEPNVRVQLSRARKIIRDYYNNIQQDEIR